MNLIVLSHVFGTLCVTVALSRNGLTYISAQICAVRGSTVDIRCVYRLPTTIKRRSVTAEKILWFTDVQDKGPVDLRTDSEYAGRVKYYCDKTTCTLRIADLRESDSSEYKFAFKHTQNRRFTRLPGVTLSVTGNISHFQMLTSKDRTIIIVYSHVCEC